MPSEKIVLKKNIEPPISHEIELQLHSVLKPNVVELQNIFYKFLETNDNELIEILKPLIKKLHNKQWTNGSIYNILSVNSNCYNNCKYCYMKRIKNKFFGTDLENLDMIVDQKKIDKKWKKVDEKSSKVIMYPSSHDIFNDYLDKYIETAINMMNAGHTLLIVTKPRLDCIQQMINKFKNYKNKILFRLTITTDDDNIVNYYEPNAPKISERIECIKLLFENKYRTSVSLEPFLTNPIKLIENIDKYVSDDIWIGCMSCMNTNTEIDDKHKKDLNKLYSFNSLKKIIFALKDNKKVFWKTSVMKIILK